MKLISGVEFTGSLEEMAQWFQEKAGQETELKVRVSSDEDTINISYKLDREQGLFEMCQKAGIAMEYLEKLEAGNNEGAFLRDWEVIYGGDKYKILEEI